MKTAQRVFIYFYQFLLLFCALDSCPSVHRRSRAHYMRTIYRVNKKLKVLNNSQLFSAQITMFSLIDLYMKLYTFADDWLCLYYAFNL